MNRICACLLLLMMGAAAPAAAQQPQKIIFDTDFAYPPQDDAMALFFVLNSPELQVLGITTVAGNRSLNVATTDALKLLEVTQRGEPSGTRSGTVAGMRTDPRLNRPEDSRKRRRNRGAPSSS
jgi:Inosine-uridine preferring nucleoside hydrolase